MSKIPANKLFGRNFKGKSFSYPFYIDLAQERYCYKCHKIMNRFMFQTRTDKFRKASRCLKCSPL